MRSLVPCRPGSLAAGYARGVSRFFGWAPAAPSATAKMVTECGGDPIVIGTPTQDAQATDFYMRFKKL